MTTTVPAPEMAARVDRERTFHDELAGTDARAKLERYYAGALGGPEGYSAALRAAARSAGPGARVLEYGCGTGSSAFDLAAEGCVVTGIDISPAAIERAAATANELGVAAEFRVMDAHHLDADDSSYDVVCGSGILHHLDVDAALAEIARVLRPSGRAVFFEPLGHNPALVLYRRLTPSMRTADERPLRWSDLDAAGRRFGTVAVECHNLLALAVAPIVDRPIARRLAGGLHRLDQRVFRAVPALRRYAWTMVIELSDPRR